MGKKMNATARLILAAVVTCTLIPGATAAADRESGFNANLLAARSKKEIENWAMATTKGKRPKPRVLTVHVNQKVFLALAVYGDEVPTQGPVPLAAALRCVDPSGKTLLDYPKLGDRVFYLLPDPRTPGLIIIPVLPTITFEETDPAGTYICATNIIEGRSGVTGTATASIKLVK